MDCLYAPCLKEVTGEEGDDEEEDEDEEGP